MTDPPFLIGITIADIEIIVTPHLFPWSDAFFASDGKLERVEYSTCFLCGYKFIKTPTNFTVYKVNNKQVLNRDVYALLTLEEELVKCLDTLLGYDFKRLEIFNVQPDDIPGNEPKED